MRTTSLITISLSPSLLKTSEKMAKKKHMTRSEFLRAALRNYIEEQQALEAIAIYKTEKKQGKLKKLRGSLVDLI